MPDMNMSHSLLYLSQARAAAELMSAVAHGDECVVLLCKSGISTAALLDEAENELSSHGLRCVRVYGPSSGGLALRDLVAQIVDRADPDALADHDLKAGFATLTEPGEGYGRVALLVTEAHNLTSSALHYIQLACRSSPKLRFALAGQPGLAAALAQDEFAYLRQRIARTLELPGPVRNRTPGLSSVLAGLRRGGVGPLARVGVVAASALLIAAVGWRQGPAPSRAALVRAELEMPAADAAPARMADAPSPADPAAAQQEGDAAAGRQTQEASLPTPTAANAPMSEGADAPVEGPASPGQPAEPAEPAGDVARDASPAFAMPPRAMEPAPGAAPPRALAVASVPVPAPQPRPSMAALPSSDASPARRPRGGTERAVATAAALPTHPTDARRCRDIVFHAQSGKDLSDADQTFLRDDCRAK
jgi:hypothetical protein